MKSVTLQRCCALLALIHGTATNAYEINNHADMSQTALARSVLQIFNGQPESETKLFKLGLKAFFTTDDKQTFPLGAGLGPIPYCYGSERPDPWKVTTTAIPPQQAGETVAQPNWVGGSLTIAQMIRYGACYEDEEEPYQRSISHFYNPQDQGAGSPLGPNSLDWMLKRNPGSNLKSGDNHFTWMDARDSFYKALTAHNPALFAYQDAEQRRIHWGKTFQALGHIVHHLQDMGSPQHVRADYHCNSIKDCDRGPIIGSLLYRPSGYEMHFERQVAFVRGLASTATTPMMFGLPREFWNVNTDDSLGTINLSAPAAPTDGIAAYTSSNFTSAAKDFYVSKPPFGPVTYHSPAAVPFPKPSGLWSQPVKIADLYPPEQAAVAQSIVNGLCDGDAEKCKMYFMGTTVDSTARTSSQSVFSQKLLRPTTAYGVDGPGVFQQNYWTYNYAVRKLVPKAVEYSAGLINYFFRGEFSIRPPEEGLYGLLDGGDTNSNCKDACGFRKIRARVTNTTAPINGAVQDMTAGTLTAVVKFSRNSCYQPDWSGDLGELGTISYAQQSGCYLGGGTEPVDEVVVSQPIEVNQLAVGSEQAFTFDFSANVIPVNSWNVQLQVVFRGTLGAEPNAVAVSTVRASAPTVLRYINEMDWIDINQNLYRTTDISSTPSLLSALTRTDCYYSDLNGPISLNPVTVFAYDENGNHIYDENGYAVGYYDWLCFPEWEAIRTNWKSQATGATLASSKLLYQGAQSVLVALGDPDTPVPFVIQYPRSYNRPSAPSVTYERSFYLRRLQWNAATPAIDGYQFWNYRGMHTSDVTSRYWKGSESTPWATWEVQKSRPPIRFAEPVPFDSIDSRYQ
jgi:hypothetical protein